MEDEIVSVERIPYAGLVYNLEVEEDESYVVNGIAVHNCLCYKAAVLMPMDEFTAKLKGWMRGEQEWAAMDQYADWLGLDVGGPAPAIAVVTTSPAIATAAARTAADVRKAVLDLVDEVAQETKRLDDEIDAQSAQCTMLFDDLSRATSAGLDQDEILARQRELEAAWDQMRTLLLARRDLQHTLRDKLRAEVYVEESRRAAFKVDYLSRFTGERREAITQGVAEFRRMVGTGTLDQETLGIKAAGRGRSSYGMDGTVYLTTGAAERSTMHEMGHWLEDMDSDVHRKALDFLDRRTAGEQPQWLGDRYGYHEQTRPDKFIEPYMGKEYYSAARGRYGTEIVSMGVEYMWAAPERLAKDDPDCFDFVYDLLRGQ